ncbi:IPT/TIG domain-containing protein [Arthrobacter humicola]|uniref:IPT/TIG domain-containing protein n=1 Tax=Arthrobacter humicola TaxID=409291 RepID=UPI001FAB4E64|nr:IPT/TIG domain-containing protein [Arthrobacter humicola]MCI9870538.1 hypothetical protein [Arthrobacter humicola]
MVFALFPDPPVAPLAAPVAGRVDAGFAQLAGEALPEFAGIYARMMFLRVAMVGGTVAPSLFVRAGQGPAVAVTATTQPVFRATRPEGGGTGFVGDAFQVLQAGVPGAGTVTGVVVGFDRATEETWTLGIRNNDPGREGYFTWVVAESEGEAVQPWADPASFVPAFADPPAAQFTPDDGAQGTPVILSGRNFNVGIPRVFFSAAEAALLAPPASGTLTVAVPEGLLVSGEPGADVPVSVQTAVGTAAAATPFRVLAEPPAFADPAFDPVSGWPGRPVALCGRNFNAGRTQVFFGHQTAIVVGHPTATSLTALVPEGLVHPGEPVADVRVKVETRAGTAVAGTAFRILLSEPPQFGDPPFNQVSGWPGTAVTLFGRNLDTGTPQVFFGRQEATVREPLAAHKLMAVVPQGLVAPGEEGADVPVSVHTVAGTATASATFHIEPPKPEFAKPFLSTQEAQLGESITLHGSNFHFAPVKVFFRQSSGALVVKQGAIVGRPSPTVIDVRVPSLPARDFLVVTVETAGGSAICPLRLRVTPGHHL